MSEYLKLPWSVEQTIENLKELMEGLKERAIALNCDEKGAQDAKEVEFDFARAIKALEADRWIPVSERLPKVNDGEWAVFLVPSIWGIGAYRRVAARYFVEQGTIQRPGWTDRSVESATYWMPLPVEPYKE